MIAFQFSIRSYESDSSGSAPVPDPDIPPRRSRAWILWAVGVIGLVFVSCCVLAGFGGLRVFQAAQGAADEAMMTVDQFMRAGMQHDTSAALRLFAASAGVSSADLDRLFEERADTFVGYTQVQQTNFNIQSGTTGTTAQLSGTLTYAAHGDRGFSAILAKEDGQWRLITIQFNDGVGP